MNTRTIPAEPRKAKTAGKTLSWKNLPPRTILLMVQSSGAKNAPVATALATERRPVIVDGILMELPEEVILGQIRNGTFIVVYPGTNIPWEAGDGRGPAHYPPDWMPPV